ncbi:MAG: DNA repair protein RecO [Candidatus Aureabacteria bacterium]|nr:DNA repair protein RecO [Candidatus Auribacterota bacterium]
MNQKTRAILLRSYKYGESSRVAVFLAPALGKVKAVLKGVEKLKSKYSKLQVFGLYDIELKRVKGRELDIVSSLEVIDNFPGIMKRSETYAATMTIIEITAMITSLENDETPLFGELCFVLDRLSQGGAGESPVRYLIVYALRSMHLAGFIGSFSECGACRDKNGPFSITSSGEIRCKRCAPPGKKVFIDLSIARLMDRITCGSMGENVYLSAENSELRKISPVVRLLLDFVLPKPLKSLDFLSSVLKKGKNPK